MKFKFHPIAVGSICFGILLLIFPDPYAGAWILIIFGVLTSFVQSYPKLKTKSDELKELEEERLRNEIALKEKERSKRTLKRLFWITLVIGAGMYIYWLNANQS